jgi:DNA-binding transcriptional LysR family regulator
LADEKPREAHLLRGVEIGELSIGAGPFPFEISVGKAVSHLLSRFPKLGIELKEVAPLEIVNRVLKGKCDIGVADIRTLHDEPLLQLEALPVHVCVFSCRPEHPLAGRRELTQNDVLAYPLVGSTFPPQLAEVFETQKAAGSVDKLSRYFTCAVNIDSLNRARQTAIECEVVFPVPIVAIEAQLRAGELVVLDCHPNWLRTNYGFFSKRDRTPSPATLEFMAVLRDIEARIMERESALLAEYVSHL